MLHTLGNLSCALPERKVLAVFRQLIFKKGRLRCPHCSRFLIISLKKEHRYFCKICRRKFSILSGTWLKNTKLPLNIFILLLWLWLEDYQVKQVKQLTGVSIPTIRKYFRLFRLHVVKTIEFKPENNVQVDEAYFGQFRKRANWLHSQRVYKVMNKVCVAGIGCPVTGQLATRVVPQRNKGRPIKNFIYQKVPTTVRVYSDGSSIYTGLRKDYFHTSRTHDLGFHHAYYIESCWSWMKRKLFKQYHHFTKKYAKEYVSELTFKFNTRKLEKNPFEYLSKSF